MNAAALLFRALSCDRAGPRLSILVFHRVFAQADPMFPGEPDAAQFDLMLGWLRSWFRILPLEEAAVRLAEGRLPAGAACITFDDGYADNFHVALPLLQKHGLAATFFIATGFLDGGRMWNDSLHELARRAEGDKLDLGPLGLGSHDLSGTEQRRAAAAALIARLKYLDHEKRNKAVAACVSRAGAELPKDLMMTAEQVRGLHRAGMSIGAHTVSHPILASIAADRARHEISESKRVLEAIVGDAITLFAYPNGKPQTDYRREHVSMVRDAGFAAAVSTSWGRAAAGNDTLQLPRFTPWNRSAGAFGLRLAHNLAARRQQLV